VAWLSWPDSVIQVFLGGVTKEPNPGVSLWNSVAKTIRERAWECPAAAEA
jgi:hypothetical protein